MKTSRKVVLIASVFLVSLCSAQTSTKRILVEYWHVGDDGYSQKLTDETERAFENSGDFQLSSGKKPGTLIVDVPSNVTFERIGKRDKAQYTVEYSSVDGRTFGRRKGSCWADEMAVCAVQIVKGAHDAAQRMKH